MILEDFIVLTKAGLYCRYADFYLDPKEPVKEAVISHAHADHAVRGNTNVYCTRPTAVFMEHRYKKNAAVRFNLLDHQSVFYIGEVAITFIPAGHMLGSAQVLMIFKDVRYLYTGDYKIESDNSCEPFEFVKADVLITETTFADPLTRHPNAVNETLKLNGTRSNIMLGAYALGKSQRMIGLITDHCPNKTILVHHSIMPFIKIYEQFGKLTGNYQPYDRKIMKNNPNDHIYLVPPMVFNSYYRNVNLLKVFVTGWKYLQTQNDMQVYISDHADWEAILYTIDQVEPTEVWTLHGDGNALVSHFKNKLKVKILNE
ncbi:MAG: exonuclease [Pedobacter sp.]|nr:MAG: exonuclease [Pedobacter sp.]